MSSPPHTRSAASRPKLAGEDAQPGEQPLLVGVEQVVGPGHEIGQGPVPGDHRASARRRGGRSGGRGARRARRGSSPGCAPRPARSPAAARRAVARSRRSPARSSGWGSKLGRAAVARPTNSWVAGASAIVAEVGPVAARSRAAATRHTCSLGSPSTSRLVARIVTPAHRLRSRSASGATVARRCSQLSSTRSTLPGPQVLDERLLDGQVLALLHVDRGRDGRHRRASGRARGPAATTNTSPSNSSQRSLASRSASRVLPTPPGPGERQQAGRRGAGSTSRASSSVRPTSCVVSAGQAPRRRAA